MAFETVFLPRLPRIDKMMPRRLESAFFGMGHFFDSEPRFGVIRGVWRTVVGYSGGQYESPSYENLGDHMEVVMIEYDPVAISYGQLLDIFLNCCGCREAPPSQGASCVSHVFVKNEIERRMAKAAVSRYDLRFGIENCVKVAMRKIFYQAEEWCQKHSLRMLPQLMDELRRIYPDEDCLLRSTLATRLNGILGQPLSRYVPEDFEFYDLSESAANILRSIMVPGDTSPGEVWGGAPMRFS